MNVYVFTFNSGWLGGSGVVVAESIEKAVELANEAAYNALFTPADKATWTPLTENDLELVSNNSCYILSNGDY